MNPFSVVLLWFGTLCIATGIVVATVAQARLAGRKVLLKLSAYVFLLSATAYILSIMTATQKGHNIVGTIVLSLIPATPGILLYFSMHLLVKAEEKRRKVQ